jgi:hypothetical protein
LNIHQRLQSSTISIAGGCEEKTPTFSAAAGDDVS